MELRKYKKLSFNHNQMAFCHFYGNIFKTFYCKIIFYWIFSL